MADARDAGGLGAARPGGRRWWDTSTRPVSTRHTPTRPVSRRAWPSAARWIATGLAALLLTGCTGGSDGQPDPDAPTGVLAWGGYTSSQTAVPEAALADVTAVSGGDAYSLALRTDGTVVAWGADREGRWEDELSAQELGAPGGATLTAISAGPREALLLTDAGRVLSWSPRVEATYDSQPAPVPDGLESGVTAISAGGWADLAVDAEGGVVAWSTDGYDLAGTEQEPPASVASGIRSVAAGAVHGLALTTGGAVIGWGADGLGQATVPDQATSGITAIAAGRYHSLALTEQGRVLGWGSADEFGTPIPVPADAQAGITAIAAGWGHSLALTEGGRVIAWGSDAYGQATVPEQAQAGVMAIGGGSNQTLAARPGAADLPPAPLPSVLDGAGTSCSSSPSYLGGDFASPTQFSALGSPRRAVDGIAAAGAVDLRFVSMRPRYPTPDPVTITGEMVGLPASQGAGFGASVIMAQVNGRGVSGQGDPCIDLVIGVPGADEGRGAVLVVPGTTTGFAPADAWWLPTQEFTLQPGDALGSALTAANTDVPEPDEEGLPAYRGALVLAAGAPGHDEPGAPDAGMVVTWLTGPPQAPLTMPAPLDVAAYVQGSGGIRGKAEPGDRFGEVLAPPASDQITIGIPSEDVEDAADAGAVARLTYFEGTLTGNELLWQGSGLPGRSEPGDRLGAAVLGEGDLIVGIPGKDVNGAADAGAVVSLAMGVSRDEPWGQPVVTTQDTPGVPDSAEQGDAFGSSLAQLIGGRCRAREAVTLAVGVPGEDGEGPDEADLGGITFLCDDSTEEGPDVRVAARQPTTGLRSGDGLGARLLEIQPEPGEDESGLSGLLAGAPGRDGDGDGDGAADVGAWFLAGGSTTWGWSDRSLHLDPLGGLGVDPGERYGG